MAQTLCSNRVQRVFDLKRLLIAMVVSCMAMPAWAEKIPLNTISNYLNGVTTAKSSFTQINADGTISTGEILMRRPHNIRFDYNPPEKALVIGTAGSVYILDRKLNAEPEVYPLRRTPLSIILARNVNLREPGMVQAHSYDGTATIITARDPEHPEYGSIDLKFTDNPVQLRQWVIDDGSGNKTTVVLGALEAASVPRSAFDIESEVEALK